MSEADRGGDGKTTLGNGQAWSLPSWRELVVKSSVVPQRPSRLRDRWWEMMMVNMARRRYMIPTKKIKAIQWLFPSLACKENGDSSHCILRIVSNGFMCCIRNSEIWGCIFCADCTFSFHLYLKVRRIMRWLPFYFLSSKLHPTCHFNCWS